MERKPIYQVKQVEPKPQPVPVESRVERLLDQMNAKLDQLLELAQDLVARLDEE